MTSVDIQDEELSFVQQAEEIFRYGQETSPSPAPSDSGDMRLYPDGYTRLSPVQPYRTLDGYYRRIILKVIFGALAAFMLLMLIGTLLKNGVFHI